MFAIKKIIMYYYYFTLQHYMFQKNRAKENCQEMGLCHYIYQHRIKLYSKNSASQLKHVVRSRK